MVHCIIANGRLGLIGRGLTKTIGILRVEANKLSRDIIDNPNWKLITHFLNLKLTSSKHYIFVLVHIIDI